MRKFTFSFKSLLVACGLLLGSANAWGDVVGFSATNRITDNGDGTFTTATNAGNQYALAIADLSGITGITGENKFITIEFDTNIPSSSRWLVGIGDKDTRGTTANGSSKSTYNTDGLVCRFGTSDGTSYRVNGGTSYSLFNVSVHATFTLNKRLGTYSLVLHNNSTDTDVYTASGTSTTVANATIVELYSWVNSSTVTVSDVTVTVKDTYEYSVNAVDGSSNKLKTLKTGSGVSGATIYYAYPRYINVNGTLYKKDKGSGDTHYEGSFTLSSGGDKNVTYAASSYTNVVYFAEGEDVLTLTTNGGNTSRCSMMASGRGASATKIVTLPAGSYNINMAFFAAKKKNFYAYKGSESDANKIFEYEGTGSWDESDQSAFTLTETTDILVKGGDSNNGIDYIIITGTPSNEIVGAVDYSTGYLDDMTNKVTLSPGESYNYKFINHNSGSSSQWLNYVVPVYTSADVKTLVIRSDNWEDVKGTDAGCTNNFVWGDANATFIEEMNGATVDMTISYNASNVLTMNAAIKTKSGYDWTYSYRTDYSGSGISLEGDIKVALSVSNSWAEVLAEGKVVNETLNTNMSGYKTFYNATTNYQVDANTTIYKAAEPSAGKVVLTDVGGNKIIKAGQAVILHTSEASIVITPTATESTGNFDDNALQVVAGTVSGKYVLGYTAANGFGFYYYTATLPAGYIYLDGDAPSVKMLNVIVDGTATGVDAPVVAETVEEDGVLYNTAGQIVTKDYKGIVIKNGKKFFNK